MRLVCGKSGRKTALIGVLILGAFTQMAAAADMQVAPAPAPTTIFTPVPASGWTITLGVEARVLPTFEGASSYDVLPVPLFDIRRAGTPRRFQAARDGASIGLFESGAFRAGATAKIRRGRDQDDDSRLAGLGDIDWTLEAGGFAEFWATKWLRTRAEVRQGFGGHHGVVADFTADVVQPVSPRLTLSGGPRLTVVSNKAESPYFSITPAQSIASGLPVYNAGGGIHSYGAGAMARYEWSPEWATHVFVEYERLSGDAADSPLVTMRGSRDQGTAGVGVTYSFDVLTGR